MRFIKTILFATALVFLATACTNNKQKQTTEIPTQEDFEEFEEAAEKVSNLMQPKTASLVFILDGTTYQLDTKNVETSIIPFAMYKPANEEEGETEASSLIWLKGTDLINDVNISFSVNLKNKIDNGNFMANEGEIIISKKGKDNYYSVKDISLVISNLKEKKFYEELSGYSLDMTFSGTIAEYGAKGKLHEIKDGKYVLRY